MAVSDGERGGGGKMSLAEIGGKRAYTIFVGEI
jgi:hypothetical protein